MPQYQYECEKHGLFEVNCRLAAYDDHKPCPKCKKSSEQVLLPASAHTFFETPIVVHVAKDGSFRCPGSTNAKCPAGYERRELRTVRDVTNFERNCNARLRSEAGRHQENEERFYAQVKGKLRSELRQEMQHFSNFGRDFARLVMAANDARSRRVKDAGFHVEVLHFDQSSRAPHRDSETGWRDRKV
jgi:putative FmdB family regulatory protein